jgi:outer membrane immunogenic protein
MKKLLAFSLSVLPFALAPVQAQAGSSFSGYYAGVELGYQDAHVRGSEHNAAGGFSGWSVNTEPQGPLGGLTGGYNYTTGKYLLGLDADIEALDAADEGPGPASNGGGGFPMKNVIQAQGSLRARGGYLVHDNTLLYATGGLALANVKSSLYTSNAAGVEDSQTDLAVGWTLGAGAEYAFAKNYTARVEYRYTDYGYLNLTATNYSGAGFYEHERFNSNALRAAVLYHF